MHGYKLETDKELGMEIKKVNFLDEMVATMLVWA